MLEAAGGFLLCAVVILLAGRRLSVYGDLLSAKTGLSRGWIGFVLLATITSLPELMVGVSAAGIVQSADLAVGDVLGSCAFNLGILALLDALAPRRQCLLGLAGPGHVLSASLGIILLCLVAFAFLMPVGLPGLPAVGLTSLLLILLYLLAVRLIYRYEQKQDHSSDDHGLSPDLMKLSVRRVVYRIIIYALVLTAAALLLPHYADQLATQTGLGKSFTGTFLLAASTSLPEIAVSIYAVRRGAIDLAVGNLLGSNIFNMLILAVDDLVYTPGLLLKDASPVHLYSVISTIMMTAIVLIGLHHRGSRKRGWLAADALLILFVYLFNLFLIYREIPSS